MTDNQIHDLIERNKISVWRTGGDGSFLCYTPGTGYWISWRSEGTIQELAHEVGHYFCREDILVRRRRHLKAVNENDVPPDLLQEELVAWIFSRLCLGSGFSKDSARLSYKTYKDCRKRDLTGKELIQALREAKLRFNQFLRRGK